MSSPWKSDESVDNSPVSPSSSRFNFSRLSTLSTTTTSTARTTTRRVLSGLKTPFRSMSVRLGSSPRAKILKRPFSALNSRSQSRNSERSGAKSPSPAARDVLRLAKQRRPSTLDFRCCGSEENGVNIALDTVHTLIDINYASLAQSKPKRSFLGSLKRRKFEPTTVLGHRRKRSRQLLIATVPPQVNWRNSMHPVDWGMLLSYDSRNWS